MTDVRHILQWVGLSALVVCIVTCGSMVTTAPRPLVIIQNPDGTVSVSEAAPWWGPPLIAAMSALTAGVGGVYLYSRNPRKAAS